MIKNKPVKPTELLINWTKFVCEFGSNFTSMDPMATELTFTQYYLVDAILIAIAFLTIFVFIVKYISCFFAGRLCQTAAKAKQN